MITRMVRGQAAQRALSRLEHPEAILLALILAAAAAIGWVSSVFWLAVAVGVQLAVGGMGAVLVLGAARPGLGLARYATLAAGGVALTVFGRVVVEFGGLLLAPLAALLLWGLLRLELAVARSGGGGWMLDVAMVAIVFAGTAGVGGLVALSAWPPGIVLVVLIGLVPSLRAA
ncbi:MAG: hypothetical protein ACRDHD_03720, partial [Candidatus Limnocylindria bacterium]